MASPTPTTPTTPRAAQSAAAPSIDEIADQDNWFNFAGFYDAIVRDHPGFNTFVEIGVWKGHSISHLGRRLVESGRPFALFAVDRWHDDYEYITDHTYPIYDVYQHNLRRHGLRPWIVDVRCDSAEAAARFPDHHFDFVFIDADHEYPGVKRDLGAWYPKVRPGGIFAGHDYGNWPGVTRAVDEFVAGLPALRLRLLGNVWITGRPV